MNNRLISVIIPVHNSAKELRRCIESVMLQTHKKLQIILVDDGSTDGSGDICDEYAKIDSRIEVIHQNNCGPTIARRRGIESARGVYIGFVDSDDYIEKDYFEYLLSQIIEKNVDFIHSGYIEEKDNRSSVKEPYYELFDYEDDKIMYLEEHEFALDTDKQTMTPSIWSKLFRASFLKSCYIHVPENLSYGEDLILKCSCILESNSFAIIPYAGYHYVIQENSLSHDLSIRAFVKECNLYTALCKWAKEYGIYERLEHRLSSMLWIRMITCINNIHSGEMLVPIYLFADVEMLLNKKVLLYGAGIVGQSYYCQLMFGRGFQIVAWADQKHVGLTGDFFITPEFITQKEYDFILIAVKQQKVAEGIIEKLLSFGVEENKIIWSKPKMNELTNEQLHS